MKKLITIPDELVEKLGKGRHQSLVVVEALTLYFLHKDTVKRLVGLADRLEAKLDEKGVEKVDNGRYEYRTLVPGKPKAKVDTVNETYYDPYLKQWISLDIL